MKNKQSLVRAIVGGIVLMILTGVLLFVAAGTVNYWQAWVYLGLTLIRSAITLPIFLQKDHEDLIQERMNPGEGTKSWDKVYYALSTPMFFILLGVAGLDIGYYHWSDPMPVWSYVLSYSGFIGGQIIMFWAMFTNKFFSSMVRIQKDRGQKVVRSGPYSIVRHPGYIGGLIMEISMPFILGSYPAMVPAAVACILLIARTALEDKTLQEELPGYDDYAQKVKYRLIPFIW